MKYVKRVAERKQPHGRRLGHAFIQQVFVSCGTTWGGEVE